MTIWMNIPAFYQGDLFRALVATGRVDLHVVYAGHLPTARRELGWNEDVSGYVSTFLKSRGAFLQAAALARRERNRIHIINGLWHEPAFAATELSLQAVGGRYAVYSEKPDDTVSRPLLVRALRRIVQQALVRGASGVLPVGRLGESWFRDLGVPQERIFPFAYFRSHDFGRPVLPQIQPAKVQELIFVGRISHVKGVDLLCTAMNKVVGDYPGLRLTILGAGTMRTSMTPDMAVLHDAGKLHFEGTVPAKDVINRIAQAAALVLPSRWDGWGLVVNEAFSVGVPAIVSDHCGAIDIVKPGVTGYVFRSGDVQELASTLRMFLARQEAWPQMRAAAMQMGRAMSVDVVAPYLVDCLEYMIGQAQVRPVAPWRKLYEELSA